MKLKKIYISVLIIFSSLMFSSLNTINKNEKYDIIKPFQAKNYKYLVKYGEYIFNRESCKNCHSLNINDSINLIPLDGLKNKYTNAWHFMNLMNPEFMSYDTNMPSYKKLNDSILNLKTFTSKLNFKESKWDLLIYEADSLYLNLKSDYIKYNDLEEDNGTVNKRTEVIALIAYLQNIPSSKELIKRNLLDELKNKKEQTKWEDLINNQNSLIFENINDKDNIEKGKNLFLTNCFMCHGMEGEGKIGPNLTDEYWLYGGSLKEIAKVITFGGKPGKGMIAWNSILKPNEIGQLLSFIKSIKNTNPKNSKIPEGIKE